MAIDLHSGQAVVASDGADIGSIKEVRGGYFKMNVPMHRDFWLSTAHIDESSTDAVVRLTLLRDQLSEHELDAPGLESGPSVTGDAILSDEDALRQREHMERELAEQRERMRNP